jgi:SAM-dependent methyltransferase
MSPDITDDEQQIQEAQYDYPYHYIPHIENGQFSQSQYWSWGMHYLGGIQLVLEQINSYSFDSLIDVGCGDGRFLRELATEYPSVDTLGIDYSERSIAMARGMNPDLNYKVINLISEDINKKFDIATCIEVLEHISPDDISTFISQIANLVINDGYLILTVPHKNKPVRNKHYQHFSLKDLESLLAPQFDIIECIPFDKQSKILTALEIALGGRGKHFIINSPFIVNTLWKVYQRRYLYADSESNCRRIAVVCRR